MTIPHALLALLAEAPKYGLRLKEEFEQRTGSTWPLNVGQVYTTLRRLERDGFVEHAEDEGTKPSQKLYSLTASGRAELLSWLSTPPLDSMAPPRDEVVIKVMVALSVADVDVIDVVQDHRRLAIESMQSITRLKQSDDDLALVLVADAQLFRLEAVVRWLDSCETRLGRGGRLRPIGVDHSVDDSADGAPAVAPERSSR
jgi:DNA-binding PadR family transcriptional regulator